MFLTDKFGRRISDLRISITDRCNYRCVYCRSGNNGAQFAEMPIADYLRIARIFVGLGITKVRLTGGEPLLRKGIVEMVSELGPHAHRRGPVRSTSPLPPTGICWPRWRSRWPMPG